MIRQFAVLALLLGFGSALLAVDPAVVLQPTKQFNLAQAVGNPSFQIRDMRAAADTLWFLIFSTDSRRFSLIATDSAGKMRRTIPFPAGTDAQGLTITSRGIATSLIASREAKLREFDNSGRTVSEAALPCFGPGQLLNVNGNPASTCPDGTILVHAAGSLLATYSSWIRPGTLAEPLSSGQIAIIDRATATLVINDPVTATLSAVSVAAPEIDTALRTTANVSKQATASLPASGPGMGRPVVAMSTTHDAAGFYVLIWPYNQSTGPTVIKISNTGQLLARYRCAGTGRTQVTSIAIQSGYLILSSTDGRVFSYKL